MGAKSSKAADGIKKACLWKADRSPACRSAMMVLDAMQLNVTEVDLDLDKGDHRCPEIMAMNPQKTLPIYRDRDVILTDSHVIGPYLAGRFCEDSFLYPKSPAARALQDHWLHYNNGVVYPKFRAAAYPMLYENCGYVLPTVVREIEATYCTLEAGLVGHSYFGGANPSLADIALVSTISTLNVIVPVDSCKYPQLCNWLCLMAVESFYKTANAKGLEEFCLRLASSCGTPEAIELNDSLSRRIANKPPPKKRFHDLKLKRAKKRALRKSKRALRKKKRADFKQRFALRWSKLIRHKEDDFRKTNSKSRRSDVT